MKIGLLNLIAFVILFSPVYGQFSMEGYLANSVSEKELGFSKAKQDFLDQNKFNSPILREVEFRARIRNFGSGFEDYRLRFSPLNPFEKKANKNYHQALSKQIEAEYRMNLEEVLLSRYLLMIEHMKLSEYVSILEESQIFYRNILSITQNRTSSSALKDYIALDKAHLKTILKLEESRNSLLKIEQTIKYTYSYESAIDWKMDEIIEVSEIRNSINSANPDLMNNLYLKNEQEKEVLNTLDYQIEKNEAFSNIGYLQFEYRADIDNLIEENLGMQVAVNLPIINKDRVSLQRQKLDMLEDTQDLAAEKKELEEYIGRHYQNLALAINKYDLVTEKMANYHEKEFNSSSSNNALDLMIELREFQDELNELQIDSRAEILSLYIELLSLNGELSKEPYINFLSREKTTFTIE